jgi:UDP-2,3-diacylglucosamine hydrolase
MAEEHLIYNPAPSPLKKIYFISDLHLGAPNAAASLKREKEFVKWLDMAAQDAEAIYIVGDLFDFWFEYKKAVPRGFVRCLGKIAEVADKGIPIHLFTGNHDMWIFDYLPSEIGCILYREPVIHNLHGKQFYIGHGDGLGPGDYGYKFIKRIFRSPFLQWCFARLHPNFGIWLAELSSRSSRKKTGAKDAVFLGEDHEWLAIYSRKILTERHIDAFVFGHRHLPLDIQLKPGVRYVNLGDWIQHFTYATFDGNNLTLNYWKVEEGNK